MLGTLLSAAELDGWIDWGHEASIAMVVPILLRIVANATDWTPSAASCGDSVPPAAPSRR